LHRTAGPYIGVRIDKTQTEHNRSAYAPIADIRADIVNGSSVPEART
jgi:hypothetical protein